MVILSSASAVSFRVGVALIRKKNLLVYIIYYAYIAWVSYTRCVD